jgi:glycosyltransferase involved in cell wall biosynthesis
MDYGPNIEAACWFAKEIWPLVRERRPDATWWIVGRSPSRAVQQLDDGRSIRVIGAVPSMLPFLCEMRVSVAPLRLARGVQTKVLTAMAAGRPCVVTSCVAEGLGVSDGREVLVADSVRTFAAAVTELLENRSRAESLGRAGFRFVADHYRTADELARLEALLIGEAQGRADHRAKGEWRTDVAVNGEQLVGGGA